MTSRCQQSSVSGKASLRSLQVAFCILCVQQGERDSKKRERSSPVTLHKDTGPTGLGPTLMTSFNPYFLPNVPIPKYYYLGVRVSTYEFWRDVIWSFRGP